MTGAVSLRRRTLNQEWVPIVVQVIWLSTCTGEVQVKVTNLVTLEVFIPQKRNRVYSVFPAVATEKGSLLTVFTIESF